MSPELQRRFQAIETQRADIQRDLLDLGEAPLNWSPGPEVWSLRQIVEHLVLGDEEIGRTYAPGAVPTEAPMFRVLPRAWRRALVLRALRRGDALPLASPAMDPRGDLPLAALLPRWEAARRAMRADMESLRDDGRRWFHPVLGPLTITQVLELGQTHTAYHMRQMAALRRDPAFPRGGPS
jgi:hypothetical protein